MGNFVNNIDREKYETLAVGITKEGRWLYTEATAAQMADGSWEELAGNMPCVISPDRADHGMILFTPEGHVEKVHVDVVIPVLHGPVSYTHLHSVAIATSLPDRGESFLKVRGFGSP